MSTVVSDKTAWQTKFLWTAIAVLGAVSFAIVALNKGEAVNAAWLVVASVCIYLIAYRFYGLFVAERALGVDGTRTTPVASENLDSCISMVQSAEDRMRNNVSEPLDWACAGRILPERNVNSYFIVIGAVFRKNLPKVLFAEND